MAFALNALTEKIGLGKPEFIDMTGKSNIRRVQVKVAGLKFHSTRGLEYSYNAVERFAATKVFYILYDLIEGIFAGAVSDELFAQSEFNRLKSHITWYVSLKVNLAEMRKEVQNLRETLKTYNS